MSTDRLSCAVLAKPGRPAGKGMSRRAPQRQQLARERIAAIGEMSAGLVHDFRNILGVIGSALNLAERHRGDSGKMEAALAAAREGLQRGTSLTAQLLTFAQPAEHEPETKDLNELLFRIRPFLAYGAGPGVTLRFEPGGDLPDCRVDAARFGAAMLNLVTNARDAMPDGGSIRIATSHIRIMETSDDSDAEAVLVRVIDDGPGMSPAVRKRIFDTWFTTKSETGTGLGMPQVAAFMRASGGCINVSSETGAGTSVDLFFPIIRTAGLFASALWNRLDRDSRGATRTAVPPMGH